MSLFKRGAVYWCNFYIDGARYQQSTGTSNRRQAREFEVKLQAEVHAGRHQSVKVDAATTFADLVARYVATAGPKLYHRERLKQLLPYFAATPLVKLTKNMAREYRLFRLSQKAIKDATINRDLSVLRHILYWAVDEGILLGNPLARLRMARERRTTRPIVSLAEEEQLLAVAPQHLAALIIAALDTGMRRGELLGQQWEHIDFTRGLLSVTRSKTPEGEAREIPLTTRLLSILGPSRQMSGMVFVYKGDAIADVKTAWKHAIENAGIRHVRFHDLRHTFNTRMLEAGVMQEVRKALMGHTSGETVHSIYTHVELPAKRDAIARLEQWVNQQRQQKRGSYGCKETFGNQTG